MKRWLVIVLMLVAAMAVRTGSDASTAFAAPVPETFLSQGAEHPSDLVGIPLFAVPVSVSSLHLCGSENILARGKHSVPEFVVLSRGEYLVCVRAAVSPQHHIVRRSEQGRAVDRYVFALRKIII